MVMSNSYVCLPSRVPPPPRFPDKHIPALTATEDPNRKSHGDAMAAQLPIQWILGALAKGMFIPPGMWRKYVDVH